MNENNLARAAEHKARAKTFKLESDTAYVTTNNNVSVQIGRDDSRNDGSVRLSITSDWVFADDALELAAFFKRLAKTVAKRNPQA